MLYSGTASCGHLVILKRLSENPVDAATLLIPTGIILHSFTPFTWPLETSYAHLFLVNIFQTPIQISILKNYNYIPNAYSETLVEKSNCVITGRCQSKGLDQSWGLAPPR